LATSGSISLLDVAVVAGQALLFTAVAGLVGTQLMARHGLHLNRLRMQGAPLAISLLLMLGLASLSAAIGLAAIIGAFLAGMILAEAREHFELERRTLPIYQFLVPFFFVLTGSQVNWQLFLDPSIIGLASTVTALAMVGKVIGCGMSMVGTSKRSIAIVGVGMIPRGEVGLIIASLGLSLGVIHTEVFGLVVMMSVVTTIVVPPILRLLYIGSPETEITDEDRRSPAGRLPEL
jgi:Kef-type K+ transport system membrane component KefB